MGNYRLYSVDVTGKIVGLELLNAETDDDAVNLARLSEPIDREPSTAKDKSPGKADGRPVRSVMAVRLSHHRRPHAEREVYDGGSGENGRKDGQSRQEVPGLHG